MSAPATDADREKACWAICQETDPSGPLCPCSHRLRVSQALADERVGARVGMGNEAARLVMLSYGTRGNLPLAVLAENIHRRASETPWPPTGKEPS